MKINCMNCNTELDAKEELQTCECGIIYGLTPYYPNYMNLKKKVIKK